MKIAALVLAAGKSSRMGFNKLLADVGGKSMIVRTVENISASRVNQIFVVTGHEAAQVQLAIKHLGVSFIHNQNFANGLATSVGIGIENLAKFNGALICLGDMPLVSAFIMNEMVEAFDPAQNRDLVIPVHQGVIGNPVLWGARYFAELRTLQGDRGARGLIQKYRQHATAIEVDDEAIALDADTPEALAHIKSVAGS